MKTLVLAAVLAAFGFTSHAQYSAKTLTRKIVPQQPQPTQPAQPQYSAPAQQPAAPHQPTPEEAKKAAVQQSKNDVKQFEFYKRRAEEGSDDAQFQLGMRYLAGKGTEKNEALGRQWLEKAARQGHKEAGQKLAALGPAPAKATPTPVPPANSAPASTEKK